MKGPLPALTVVEAEPLLFPQVVAVPVTPIETAVEAAMLAKAVAVQALASVMVTV